MIHGPELPALKDLAKIRLQKCFVAMGEADGTQPTLRAMYVLKVMQAQEVLAGRESVSRQIEREAEDRGYTAFQMATIILYLAGESIELEATRIKLNIEIDNAPDETEIMEVLSKYSIDLNGGEADPFR